LRFDPEDYPNEHNRFKWKSKRRHKCHVAVCSFYAEEISSTQLRIHNISERIKSIEKEEKRFQEVIDDIQTSDAVLWAFPLYYYWSLPSIRDLLSCYGREDAKEIFRDKYTAV
jgi:flavorubredoxin